MNFVLQQVFERRLEILAHDVLMTVGLYLFTVVVMALYSLAVITSKKEIYELVPVLLISLVVFVAVRGDFLIHRAGGYIRYVESQLPEASLSTDNSRTIMAWEHWKETRENGWVMVAADIAGALVLMFVLFKTQVALWSKGEQGFVTVTSLLIIGAAAAIPKVVSLAAR